MKRGQAARQTPKTTLAGVVAQSAAVAVVLRRGPTRHWQLLTWDLRTDVIVPGQWLVGTVDSFHLAPSGNLMIYVARKGGKPFTAVSRPPYFSALAFWKEGKWPMTAGGFFSSDDELVMNVGGPPDEGMVPPNVDVTNVWEYFWTRRGRTFTRWNDAMRDAPEATDGWRSPPQDSAWQKTSVAGLVLERGNRPSAGPRYRVVNPSHPCPELDGAEWADWSPDGALLHAAGGFLYRKSMATPGAVSVCVADLRPNVFTRVMPPPDALRWPNASR